MLSVGLLAILAANGSCSARVRAEEPRDARQGEITLTVMLLTRGGAITAGEPLLARIEFRNRSDADIRLCRGNSNAGIPSFSVRDGGGRLLAASPFERSFDEMYYYSRLGPRARSHILYVITALYEFKRPGRYRIQVQQFESMERRTIIAEGGAWVRVLPFDALQLKARCEELFQPLLPTSKQKYGDLPIGARTKALYSVRHDIALPYLEWMAGKWNTPYPIRAMRRLGSERARKLVKALAARNDSLGRAARHGLDLPLKITFWDIMAD